MAKIYKIIYPDLLKIINLPDLRILTSSVCCPNCKHPKIVDYENDIYVNDLFDVILRGKCCKCGKPVSRYIETGEDENSVKILKKIIK